MDQHIYCKNEQCPDYQKRPICFNHAYVMCENYTDYADLRENLNRIYKFQGLEQGVEE